MWDLNSLGPEWRACIGVEKGKFGRLCACGGERQAAGRQPEQEPDGLAQQITAYALTGIR
jgi:hypothetical protein